MKEIPPTAGLPIYLSDLFSPIFKKGNHGGSLEEDFKNYLSVPYAQITYSGTAAFYIILEALKDLSHKKSVVIPSFICPLVALAIKRANLKTVVCDINKDNFNFEPAQLEELCAKNNDILAIVAVHMAGIPIDITQILRIAEKNKIFFIEDCAQSLGAVYKGKKVGTFGDFAFFSLCRGKGLSIYEGGVLVTKKYEYAALIEEKIKGLVKNNFLSEGLKILELFGYWIFYRPVLFWFVFRLPQKLWYWRKEPLRAMGDYFTASFPIHRVSRIRKLIGHSAFNRLEKEIDKQRGKVFMYLEGLKNATGITPITESPGDRATYPYLTLIFDSPEKREKILRAFENSGLGVFQIYACAITDYEYLKDIVGNKACPNGRYITQRHISLSTSIFLSKEDISLITDKMEKL